MDLQFYPTPKSLAKRLWSLFKGKDFGCVLEPSAGNGDLAENNPWRRDDGTDRFYRGGMPIDVCEIDVSKHPLLKSKGFRVVGVDFLEYKSGAHLTHIILNPPFAEGVKHVLHAWNLLWDGEIAAIINAETIKNPMSAERKLLVSLIERYGSVEFVEEAFLTDETERKTAVEVALVHLRKVADPSEIVGDILKDMRQEQGETDCNGFKAANDVMLPANFIENVVLSFDAAVLTMKQAVVAEARANYYSNQLGQTLATVDNDTKGLRKDSSVGFVQKEIKSRYIVLKDKAWTTILRSSNVTSKLSSAAQKRVEAEFETLKAMEFTVANIYGFLLGISEQAGEIQNQMVLDIFDLVSKYHDENTCFYRGWRSNTKHRTAGMRLKTTRFILPGHRIESWSRGASFETMQTLRDLDKVFCMLDGKAVPTKDSNPHGIVTLEWAFNHCTEDLLAARRVSSTYFDVRFYKGIGTIHFFPKSKELMDRLNRVVGRQRQWLPPSDDMECKGFWANYDQSEKLDKEFRAEVKKSGGRSYYRDHLHTIACMTRDENELQRAMEVVDRIQVEVQARHNIDADKGLEFNGDGRQLLLAA